MDTIIIYDIPLHAVRYLYKEWDRERPVAHSLFLSKNKNDVFIAIDNEADGFLIEEFDTREKAICWLLRKDYSRDEIMDLEDFIIKDLVRKNNFKIYRRYRINNGLSF